MSPEFKGQEREVPHLPDNESEENGLVYEPIEDESMSYSREPGLASKTMADEDIDQVTFNANWYNRKPISEDEFNSPTKRGTSILKGMPFTRDATASHPICISDRRAKVRESRQVKIIVIDNEKREGRIGFGSTDKYEGSETLPQESLPEVDKFLQEKDRDLHHSLANARKAHGGASKGRGFIAHILHAKKTTC